MFARFFSAPNGGLMQDDLLFVTDEIISYDYTKRWSSVGDFTMVLPFRDEFLSKLTINGTIGYDDDWLFVQGIRHDGRYITLTGKDCKGLLDLRITEYGGTSVAGAEGYDVVSGTTAQCVKHYLDANAVISDADIETYIQAHMPTATEDEKEATRAAMKARRLPLSWSSQSVSGLVSDSYMARLEYLSEVVSKLCDGADIGYDVRAHGYLHYYNFMLLQGTNRSFSQSSNPRIIFTPGWGNVRSMTFDHSVNELYNMVYAVDVNDSTSPIPRGDVPSGVMRRECTVSVSVSSTDPSTRDYFAKYALEQVESNTETHSYTIEPSVSGYGTDYTLGDIVTVLEPVTGNQYNATITEVTKTYAQGRKDITITLGTQKKKPLQKIVNDLISGTARRR